MRFVEKVLQLGSRRGRKGKGRRPDKDVISGKSSGLASKFCLRVGGKRAKLHSL